LVKLELDLVGVVEDARSLASILGCRVSSLPMTYLGFPLGASFSAKLIWIGVIEEMERHLAGYKRLYLSKGGRITLIKEN
jgi:hypothetical protein